MSDCTPRTLHAVTALSIETSEDAFLEVIQGEIFAGFILGQGDDLPASWVKLTLPLSGRQGDCGGEAESRWWPVHSKGLLCPISKRSVLQFPEEPAYLQFFTDVWSKVTEERKRILGKRQCTCCCRLVRQHGTV